MSDIDTREMRKWSADRTIVASNAMEAKIAALCDALDAARFTATQQQAEMMHGRDQLLRSVAELTRTMLDLDAARARIRELETPEQWLDRARPDPDNWVVDPKEDIINGGDTGCFCYMTSRPCADQWFRAVQRFIPDDGSRNAGEASHIEVLGPFATRAEAEEAK